MSLAGRHRGDGELQHHTSDARYTYMCVYVQYSGSRVFIPRGPRSFFSATSRASQALSTVNSSGACRHRDTGSSSISHLTDHFLWKHSRYFMASASCCHHTSFTTESTHLQSCSPGWTSMKTATPWFLENADGAAADQLHHDFNPSDCVRSEKKIYFLFWKGFWGGSGKKIKDTRSKRI